MDRARESVMRGERTQTSEGLLIAVGNVSASGVTKYRPIPARDLGDNDLLVSDFSRNPRTFAGEFIL